MRFFKAFEVREVVAKPRCRVRELPEYTYENWRGDLSRHYRVETDETAETDRPQL